MKKRVFWFGSLFLILLAMSLHLEGIGAAQNRFQKKRDAIITKNIEQQQILKAEAKQLENKSDECIIFGWISGILSVICLFFSYRREEPAPRSILIGLLAFYILLQFAEV
jgi:hypothetical protein